MEIVCDSGKSTRKLCDDIHGRFSKEALNAREIDFEFDKVWH